MSTESPFPFEDAQGLWVMPTEAGVQLPKAIFLAMLRLLAGPRNKAGQVMREPNPKELAEVSKLARIMLDMEAQNQRAREPLKTIYHEHRVKLDQQLQQHEVELAEAKTRVLKQVVDAPIDGRFPAEMSLTKEVRLERQRSEILEILAIEIARVEAEERAGTIDEVGDEDAEAENFPVQPTDPPPPATGISAA